MPLKILKYLMKILIKFSVVYMYMYYNLKKASEYREYKVGRNSSHKVTRRTIE